MSKVRIALMLSLCFMLLVVPTVGAQEPVELMLWHHWGGNRLEMIDKMIADFEAQYPWIKVEHVYSGTVGAADRMGTLLISGAAPEIMMVRGTYAFQFMSHGGFLALDDLIERDSIDLAMYNQGDLRSFQLLGSTYALPSMSGSAWTNLMFYNKDIMNNAGLDADHPFQTWTDWRSAAQRMARVGENGVVIQGGSHVPYLSQLAAWNGSLFWSDDWRQAQAETPETIEAVEFMSDLVADTYGTMAAHNAFYRYGDSFWEGVSSTFFTNNSGFAIAQEVDFDWGVALAPVNEKNPNAQPVGLVSSTWAYGIPATIPDEKLEAAWLFLKWITVEEEGAGYFSRVQGRPSPVIEFNRHPDYAFQNPYWNVVVAALAHDVAAPPVGVLGIIDSAGTEVVTGAKHPQQALADADRRIQVLLDQYWETVGE